VEHQSVAVCAREREGERGEGERASGERSELSDQPVRSSWAAWLELNANQT